MNGSTGKSIALKIEKHNTTCKIEINKINKINKTKQIHITKIGVLYLTKNKKSPILLLRYLGGV